MSINAELEAALRAQLDRAEVAEFIVTNSMLGDQLVWDRYVQRYAPKITVDYSSTLGDQSTPVDRDVLMPYWKSLLEAFDVTQHIVTNVVVTLDGDQAQARSYVISNHRIDKDVWCCGGIYEHGLQRAPGKDGGWIITAQRFTSLWESGDHSVFDRGIAKAIPSPFRHVAANA